MARQSIFYLPHGGGPLPVLGEPGHKALTAFLSGLHDRFEDVRAIILVTAHWETPVVHMTGAAQPGMIFDYFGFPPETYRYRYPAPGAPDLAQRAAGLLAAAGVEAVVDPGRGFDHGTFIPMMLARPEADIPILQMSILSSLDPAKNMAVGRALAPLLNEGVVLVGSGLAYHNLRAMLRGEPMVGAPDEAFDSWLTETLVAPDRPMTDREARLNAWTTAPGARDCQPREDHLVPLFTCFGAAAAAGLSCETIFHDRIMGFLTSGYAWSQA